MKGDLAMLAIAAFGYDLPIDVHLVLVMLHVVHLDRSNVSTGHAVGTILHKSFPLRVYKLLAGVSHKISDSEHFSLIGPVTRLPDKVLSHLLSLGVRDRRTLALLLSDSLFR